MRINFNIPPKNQMSQPRAFDELINKAFPGVTNRKPNFEQKYEALNRLFDKPLSSDQAKKIFMIWGMTIFASGMTEKVNVSEDEDTYLNGIISSIESLKKGLVGWEKHGTTFHINSVILGKEPHIQRYLNALDELFGFVTSCLTNKRFGNGADFNPDYIKKYGVFTLFHLGIALGLPHTKRDSPLFNFMAITTDLEKSKISKYYQQYSEPEFTSMLQDNTFLHFIYLAHRAVLDPSVNPRFPAMFVTRYTNNFIFNKNQWC